MVIYESVFSNTEPVAREIGEIPRINGVKPEQLAGLKLPIVGLRILRHLTGQGQAAESFAAQVIEKQSIAA
jgi:hypothetical protein